MENGFKYMNGVGGSVVETNGDSAVLVANGHAHGTDINGLDLATGGLKSVDKNSFATPGDRIKRKAKRLTKFLAKEVSMEIPTVTSRQLKNSRKSRAGLGRGLPKKGGAGGKGTWGALGSELAAVAALDFKDPNYTPSLWIMVTFIWRLLFQNCLMRN